MGPASLDLRVLLQVGAIVCIAFEPGYKTALSWPLVPAITPLLEHSLSSRNT